MRRWSSMEEIEDIWLIIADFEEGINYRIFRVGMV